MALRMSGTQKGFTLPEMLVVLVLAGLISSLLLEGLQHALRLQERFGAEHFRTTQAAMQIAWFRHTVNGLVPDFPDGKHIFRGERRQIRGLTLSPLTASGASLEPFSFRIRFDRERGQTLLEYGERDDSSVVMSWPGDAGAFVFVDASGKSHGEWPPFLGKWPQLPASIRLEAGWEDGGVLVAAPKGPVTPFLRLRDVEKM